MSELDASDAAESAECRPDQEDDWPLDWSELPEDHCWMAESGVSLHEIGQRVFDEVLEEEQVAEYLKIMAGDFRGAYFATVYHMYVQAPDALIRENRDLYDFLRVYVFHGREFRGG